MDTEDHDFSILMLYGKKIQLFIGLYNILVGKNQFDEFPPILKEIGRMYLIV